MTRAPAKTAALSLRVSPEIKNLLAAAAAADRRSLANMLEVIVLEYCERRAISAAEPGKTEPA